MIGNIFYIIGKGISIAIKPYFLKTKKVDTRRQNTNFSIFIYQANTALPRRLWAPLPSIKREIYNMRPTTSERSKESDHLVEKKKGG